MFELPSSVTPLNQYKSEAIMANALKFAYSKIGDYSYINEYHRLRERVSDNSGIADLANMRMRIILN